MAKQAPRAVPIAGHRRLPPMDGLMEEGVFGIRRGIVRQPLCFLSGQDHVQSMREETSFERVQSSQVHNNIRTQTSSLRLPAHQARLEWQNRLESAALRESPAKSDSAGGSDADRRRPGVSWG